MGGEELTSSLLNKGASLSEDLDFQSKDASTSTVAVSYLLHFCPLNCLPWPHLIVPCPATTMARPTTRQKLTDWPVFSPRASQSDCMENQIYSKPGHIRSRRSCSDAFLQMLNRILEAKHLKAYGLKKKDLNTSEPPECFKIIVMLE